MTIERKQSELELVRRRAEDAETMITDLVTKVEELKGETAMLRDEVDARDRVIARHEARLAELSSSHGFTSGNLSDRDKKIQALQQELDRRAAEITRLKGELIKSQHELDRVRSEANAEVAALREIIDSHHR
jgi:peptidoglycan hydrolase CwlO-like protein